MVQDVLDDFAYNNGPGPDIKDLHLDCRLGRSLAWNTQAMDLIVAEFDDRLVNDTQREWPIVAVKYLEEMVWRRFYKLVAIWRDGQVQLDSNGEEEQADAVLDQLEAKKARKAKQLRHWTRRSNVCD